MPEIRQIPVLTTATVSGNNIAIKSEYSENLNQLPNIIQSLITNTVEAVNNISHIEGELIIISKNSRVTVYFNPRSGELFLRSLDNDAQKYSIDFQTGQLQYTQ